MSQKVKIRLPTQKSLKKNKMCQKSTDITRVDGTHTAKIFLASMVYINWARLADGKDIFY